MPFLLCTINRISTAMVHHLIFNVKSRSSVAVEHQWHRIGNINQKMYWGIYNKGMKTETCYNSANVQVRHELWVFSLTVWAVSTLQTLCCFQGNRWWVRHVEQYRSQDGQTSEWCKNQSVCAEWQGRCCHDRTLRCSPRIIYYYSSLLWNDAEIIWHFKKFCPLAFWLDIIT